ncbi:MAG TPA: tRNA epoxyqueuosine(34) reductase QueG [Haliangiales bacterium]|nr:tRNA epoxyqueuosine(34) reductase QueG [Haliangiales bacterium]
MKSAIRQHALELGFDVCRFTTADPPSSASHFQQWLASHRHGEMGYLQRNASKRVDPQRVLPGVKSIICLAASYSRVPGSESQVPDSGRDQPGTVNPKPGTARGVVARYARYADYHDALGGRLKQLTGLVNQLGGAGTRSLWYVDTGPLLERDLAQRAGLGFIGKHTNLISRRLGNWVFLAEIITTLELAPDAPEKNRCGTCARCIDACPTRAIRGPFQLDARLCISYLTIELKGPIPLELRPAVGNRIYGCDDCLAVCPWNRFAREGKLMKEHARPDLELEQTDLIDLLSLDDAGFKRKFAGTPLSRARRRGLLRNVCVALGNVGDAAALPALERAAGDPEPLIAEHAEWAGNQIRQRQAAQTT